MNQLFNLIRYIVTKIIFKRGSFTHCILISCAKQLRIFYKNFQTHSGEGIVLCIFIKYTQNMAYMIYQHSYTKYKHSTTVYYPLFCTIYLMHIHNCILLNGVGWYVRWCCRYSIPHCLCLHHRSLYILYVYIYSTTLTIHEKMRMWDDV